MRKTENTLHAAQALVLGVSVFADLAFLGGTASAIGAALSGLHLLGNAPFASKGLDRFTQKALNAQFKAQKAILRDGDRENIEDMLGTVSLDPTRTYSLPRTGEAFAAEMLKHLTGDYAEARLRNNFARIVAPVIDVLLAQADFKAALDETRAHLGDKRDAETHRMVRALTEQVDAFAKSLDLQEKLVLALARKYADNSPDDFAGALAGLEAALNVAHEAGDQLPSNADDAVNEIVARVDALNREGELDAGWEEITTALAAHDEEDARREQAKARLVDKGLAQAVMRADVEGAALMALAQAKQGAPAGVSSFALAMTVENAWYQRGQRIGVPFDLEVAVALARAAIDSAGTDADRASAHNNLANALASLGVRQSGPALLADAVAACRAALEVFTRENHPVDWAMITQNLANALQEQASRTEGPRAAELFAEAVAAYRAALEVFTRENQPVAWAMTTQNLAIALKEQASRTEGPRAAELFAEAVAAYRDALEVRTRDAQPVNWATTTQNLAIALSEQARRTEGPRAAELFAEAVAAYRAALEVFTRENHPVDWAMTTQNLAIALQDQARRTEGPRAAALFADSVAAFRAALEVTTRENHPVDWATTTQNLAIALKEQASRTEGPRAAALFAEAVAAYRAALEVRTRDDQPFQWAQTQENLALCELSWAAHDETADKRPHLDAALVHVDNALDIYDPETLPYGHGTATRLRDDIHAALDSLEPPA